MSTIKNNNLIFFSLWRLDPVPYHGVLLWGFAITQDTPHSVGLPWKSGQPHAETST
jgi:hypothetical protein